LPDKIQCSLLGCRLSFKKITKGFLISFLPLCLYRPLSISRFIGEARTQIAAYLSAAAYNLLRIAKLQSAGSAA
jgi:hypothetical protein